MAEQIKRGYVLQDAVPVRRQEDRYIIESSEFGVQLFLRTPQSLRHYIDRALREKLATPCVVDRPVNDKQKCSLLVPPGIDRESGLFVPEMYVPQLAVHSMLGDAYDSMGFLLESHHLGSQLLYAYPEYVQSFDVYYNGIIKMVYGGDDKRHPRVCVIMNSNDDSDVFEQNEEALRKLQVNGRRKWWEEAS